MSSRDALRLAKEQGVDLVEIAANANPPVVKTIDWGKFQYQQAKELAKNRKKAREKQAELKTIKIGLKISDNDLGIKARKINKFLDNGDYVRIIITLRGREMAHKDLAQTLLDKTLSLIETETSIVGKANFSGRNLSVQVRKK